MKLIAGLVIGVAVGLAVSAAAGVREKLAPSATLEDLTERRRTAAARMAKDPGAYIEWEQLGDEVMDARAERKIEEARIALCAKIRAMAKYSGLFSTPRAAHDRAVVEVGHAVDSKPTTRRALTISSADSLAKSRAHLELEELFCQ